MIEIHAGMLEMIGVVTALVSISVSLTAYTCAIRQTSHHERYNPLQIQFLLFLMNFFHIGRLTNGPQLHFTSLKRLRSTFIALAWLRWAHFSRQFVCLAQFEIPGRSLCHSLASHDTMVDPAHLQVVISSG